MTDDGFDRFAGTRPVDERLRFDVTALERYLRDRIEDFAGRLEVEQFKGGQSNPTYLLTAGDRRFVLRRKPPGKLLASAHAVDREYRVMTALAGSDVPVARTHCLCEDDSVIGTAFYVMDFVAGRVFWDPTLPALGPGARGPIYDEMNRVIAALHRVDVGAAGLADYGRPGNYIARQIDRWTRQYRASAAPPIDAMERLADWLPAHLPPGEEASLVHGDFRLDNLIFHPTEPRILAVLDWELSTLGHPLADFSYHCMAWHLDAGVFRGIADADLAALGIPDEASYVAAYLRRTGRDAVDPDDWDFYLAYNLFRLGGILHGIMGRVVAGNAASADALAAGRAAPAVAEVGWRLARQIAARHCN